MPSAPQVKPGEGIYAVLDLGTHNCRLLVARAHCGGFRVIDSFSRIVRLGEGLDATGRLDPAAMVRGIEALSACARRLARYGPVRLRAVATEACRRAVNGAEFLAAARAATGLALEIISTREEAQLAMESCAPLLEPGPRRVLLFDIGGGSTELVWLRLDRARPELIGFLSLPLGVVTLAERFPDLEAEEGFFTTVAAIAQGLVSFEVTHCIGREIAAGGVRMLGASGTTTTLAGLALGLPRYRREAVDGVILAGAAIDQAVAEVRRLGREGLLAHPCVGPDRAQYVLPGSAILTALRRLWPAEEVMVADRGLREGMLMRLIRAERAGGRLYSGRRR